MPDEPTPTPTPPAPDPTTAPPPPAPAPAPPRTFSQDEVNSIATREKAQGERAANAAVAEALGMTVEDAAKVIADKKARDDAEKSELDKANEQVNTLTDQVAKASGETLSAQTARLVDHAIIRAGVSDLDQVSAIGGLVKVEADEVNVDTVVAAVEQVRETFPQLFDDTGTGAPKPAPKPGVNSNPTGNPPRPAGAEDAFSRGMERGKKDAQSRGYAVLDNNS